METVLTTDSLYSVTARRLSLAFSVAFAFVFFDNVCIKETTASPCCCGFLGEEEQVILCCEAGLTCREALEDKPTFKAHSKKKSSLYNPMQLDLKGP